jgi:hypothetical protein
MSLFNFEPIIAIVDDKQDEINDLFEEFRKRQLSTEFFKVELDTPLPAKPIPSIKTIFLDLYLQEGRTTEFDPEFCAAWVDSLVPEFAVYNLIFWTKDVALSERVLSELEQINRKPVFVSNEDKTVYRTGDKTYDVELLLEKIDNAHKVEVHCEEIHFFGELIEVEENHVLINCLVNEPEPVFQVRRFDTSLLKDHVGLENGTFLQISIKTEKGKRTIEVHPVYEDISDKFKQKDYFSNLKDLSFFKKD